MADSQGPLGSGCILNSVLHQNSKPYNVYLAKKTLCWYPEGTDEHSAKNTRHCIPVNEILAIKPFREEADQNDCGDIELIPFSSTMFAVYAIKRLKHHKWREKKIVFDCKESPLCKEWLEAVKGAINEIADRPKRLLVFVNPVGGKKLAGKIYKEKIEPLFDLANIKSDVIVTQRANHAKDYLEQEALEKVDGVICVGGDGMFHEILNGIIMRTQQDYDVDTSNPEFQAVCPKLPIGVIPAGSTDAVAYCTTGINDPVTSALHIIIGDIHPLDVCSVNNGHEVLRYSVSMMAYGFFGDVLQDSEKFRWMGPKRYDCSGFKKFMANKGYEGTVKFLSVSNLENSPQDNSRCRSGCFVCSQTKDTALLTADTLDGTSQVDEPLQADGSQWHTIKGKFISVIGANMSCACAKSPEGLSPSAHLADGCIDLILVKHTSRLQYLRHMLRLAGRSDHFNFNFVDVFRVKEFHFKPLHDEPAEDCTDAEGAIHDKDNDSQALAVVSKQSPAATRPRPQKSIWNVDGEVVSHAPLVVRVHRQLVRIFSRGIEECEDTPSCRVCRRK